MSIGQDNPRFNMSTYSSVLVNFPFDITTRVNQIVTSQIRRQLTVIDATINSGKTLNVLCHGDSFTEIGTWVNELKVLLNSKSITVNQIGIGGEIGSKK